MLRIFLKWAFVLALIAVARHPAMAEDTLAKVRAAGKVSVGVKNDYRPWGFLDPSGQIVGMEVDLGRDIAKRLGVEPVLVPVVAANRMEFLAQGNIDMVIATMSDTPERRKVIGMIEPQYYASATNVLAPKSAHLHQWTDLTGKKVCGIQGAFYNRSVEQKYKVDLVSFASVPDALKALQSGTCIAFVYDDTFVQSRLSANDPQWADYEMPLKSEDPQAWAIGVRLDDVSGPFGEFLKKTSEDWHRTGYLIELEKKWEIKPSSFLVEMHDKYTGK
jgi:polar amino acid transport system substrate-binding protein